MEAAKVESVPAAHWGTATRGWEATLRFIRDVERASQDQDDRVTADVFRLHCPKNKTTPVGGSA